MAATIIVIAAVQGCSNSKIQNGKNIGFSVKDLDSIEINATASSGLGNFFLADSTLMFADYLYSRIFSYNVESGKFVKTWLDNNNGENPTQALMYACNLSNNPNRIIIIDNSLFLSILDTRKDSLYKYGRIDFKWSDKPSLNFNSPSVYNVAEMADLGLNFFELSENKFLIPIEIVNRSLSYIDNKRYKKGRIWGEVNLRPQEARVTGLKGIFPKSFLDNPTLGFEFFDYEFNPNDSTFFVSFAPDPAIYVYSAEGEILRSFGLDADAVDRNYTKGYSKDSWTSWKEDMSHVGANTGIYFDKDNNILFRTIFRNMASGDAVLQGYRDDVLILEEEMPKDFLLLGKYNGKYWGIKYKIRNDTEDVIFTLYSFTISDKNFIG